MVEDVPALQEVARRFRPEFILTEATPLGEGHIHDTYRVTGQAGQQFVVQRINTEVFSDVSGLMQNMEQVTYHLGRRARNRDTYCRSVLRIIRGTNGENWENVDGLCWRMLAYESNTIAPDSPTELTVHAAGHAFAEFVGLLADYNGPRLHEVIPSFHDASRRLQSLLQAIECDACNRSAHVASERAFILERDYLTKLPATQWPLRIVHNDAKVNNLLLDAGTLAPRCVVDLDTVMEGYVAYDIGDLIRTSTSLAAEDARELDEIMVQPALFRSLVSGYLAGGRSFLVPGEWEGFVLAGKYMSLMMGIRFLTDYLEGDVYYKTSRPAHNLDRCRAQLRLVASLETQEAALEGIVRELV